MDPAKVKSLIIDEFTKPQVGIPTTGAAWALGHMTAEQWLTTLSIVAVVIQILISLPKLKDSYLKKRKKNVNKK